MLMKETFKAEEIETGYHPKGFRIDRSTPLIPKKASFHKKWIRAGHVGRTPSSGMSFHVSNARC